VYPHETWDLLDRPAWTEQEYREIIAHYYGFVSYIDAQVGVILDALEESGQVDNTIVVFTTDHGDLTGAHGMIFKAMVMYEELIRVPLIVRYPGVVPPGSVCTDYTHSIDLMPTLLEWAGAPVPEGVEGESLRGVLEDGQALDRDAAFSSFPALGIQTRMIRTDRWKYCLNWRPRQVDELYDLESDPHETINLAGDPGHEAIADELRGRILQWMESIGDPWLEEARVQAFLPPLRAIEFDFTDPAVEVYWNQERGLRLGSTPEGLAGTIECPGYLWVTFDQAVEAGDYPRLEIAMSTTAGDRAQVYWTTQASPAWDEPKSVLVPIESDGEVHRYVVDLSGHELWAGQRITGLRLNPVRRRPEEPEGLAAEVVLVRIGAAEE
jgi:hypothetical protein